MMRDRILAAISDSIGRIVGKVIRTLTNLSQSPHYLTKLSFYLKSSFCRMLTSVYCAK